MKYIIRGKNITITDAMRNYMEENLDRLSKFGQIRSDDTAKIDVRFYNEKEARITTVIDIEGKNNLLKADVADADFYKAVDKTRKELERQIMRIKEKTTDNHHRKEKLAEVIVDEELARDETMFDEE